MLYPWYIVGCVFVPPDHIHVIIRSVIRYMIGWVFSLMNHYKYIKGITKPR